MAGLGLLKVGLLLLVFMTADVTNGCSITIRNNCHYTVTTCAESGSSINRYDINAGRSRKLDFGSACNWPDGSIFASVGGQCSDKNMANVAEFTLGGFASSDYYDLSNINAYTIGLAIRPIQIAGGETPSGQRCGSPQCVIDEISFFSETSADDYICTLLRSFS